MKIKMELNIEDEMLPSPMSFVHHLSHLVEDLKSKIIYEMNPGEAKRWSQEILWLGKPVGKLVIEP